MNSRQTLGSGLGIQEKLARLLNRTDYEHDYTGSVYDYTDDPQQHVDPVESKLRDITEYTTGSMLAKEPIDPEVVAYLEQNPELLPYYDALISRGELPNDALAGAINDYIADQEGPQPDYGSDAQGFASNERERRRRQGDLRHLSHPVLRGKPGGRP